MSREENESTPSPSDVHMDWVKERAPVKASRSKYIRKICRKDPHHSGTCRKCVRSSNLRSACRSINSHPPIRVPRSCERPRRSRKQVPKRTAVPLAFPSHTVSSWASTSHSGQLFPVPRGKDMGREIWFCRDGVPETLDQVTTSPEVLTSASIPHPVTASWLKDTIQECITAALPSLVEAIRSAFVIPMPSPPDSDQSHQNSTSDIECLQGTEDDCKFSNERDLTMATIVPLVYEALPESFCQRPPVASTLAFGQNFAGWLRTCTHTTFLPQSNQLFKELLTYGSALRQTTKRLDPAAQLPPPNKLAAKRYFGIKHNDSRSLWHLRTFPEAERLPADCPADCSSNVLPPQNISITLQQYEVEERMIRAALRANSHVELIYSAAFANLQDLCSTNDPQKASRCHANALLLMMKAAIFHAQAMHWTTRLLANSMLHRRDGYLESCQLSPAQKLTLRCLPFHDVKTLFCGQLTTLAPFTNPGHRPT